MQAEPCRRSDLLTLSFLLFSGTHMTTKHTQSSQNFRLLGYYKQYNAYDFMEQLVEHHGSCTWTNTQNSLMSNTYKLWPNGCSYTGITTNVSIDLYIDLRPQLHGRMEVGLYEDSDCLSTYHGSDYTLAQVWQSYAENYGANQNHYYGNGNDLNVEFGTEEYVNEWNKAMTTYQYCQPCKVSNVYSYIHGDRRRERHRFLEDQEKQFQCQDSSGEVNLNQCAVFAKDTDVSPAYFKDLQLAMRQGSIVAPRSYILTRSNDYSFDRWQHNWGFFSFSLLMFFVGMVTFACLVKIKTRVRNNNNGGSEPLIMSVSHRGSSSTSSVVDSPAGRSSSNTMNSNNHQNDKNSSSRHHHRVGSGSNNNSPSSRGGGRTGGGVAL